MTLRCLVLSFLCTTLAHGGAKPIVLSHDDGKQDTKRSMAGNGQAVRFENPSEKFTLTGARIYGARYGGRYDAFMEVAQVSVCDASLKPIATATVPLEAFAHGTAKWVDIPIQPLRPPQTFFLHVNFFAESTKGVYLGIDTNAGGHSITGTLGKPGSALSPGDWMMRAVGTTRAKAPLVLDPSTKKTLSYTDGEPESKRSSAGAGHAVQFTAPSGEWYLGDVSIHGSMYGGNFNPSRTFFHVFVCDSRMRVLSRSAHPYSLFSKGAPDWVTLKVPPYRLKGKFFILIAFNPTQSKGVYLSIAAVKRSHSLIAMPNRPMGKLGSKQEWMIRAACMKRGKGNALVPAKRGSAGATAMQLAEWKSSLGTLEEKEDAAGIQRLLTDARKSSQEDADALGMIHMTEHVLVRYQNVPDVYAHAVARLYETCDASLRKRFGVKTGICPIPGKRLHVHLLAEKGSKLALWTSPGSSQYPLIVNRMPTWKRGLSPPSKGGPHIVYGLCHELGHVLVGWEDSRHKWAHYLGSLLVDDVAEELGATAWPQPYDIRAEGVARFTKEITGTQPDRTTDEGTARIFYEVGETFGLTTWGTALSWMKKNRKGKPFHAVRLYRLDDLRDALRALDCDPTAVKRIFG